MWRYLKSAFLVSVDVPGLGRVPLNALAATAFGILGFAQPAFWLLGLAFEAAVVPALAFNPRFQKVVEAQSLEVSQGDAERKRQALVEPGFADLKFNRKIDRFQRRGRSAASSEWRLLNATQNLLKLHRRQLALAGA